MSLPPFSVVVVQRGVGDCGIAALAMLTGKSYEDVLEAASRVQPRAHHKGLWMKQIQRIAAALGTNLHNRRKFNLEEDCGILSVDAHVVMVRDGVVIDPQDGCVWFDTGLFAEIPATVGPILRLED